MEFACVVWILSSQFISQCYKVRAFQSDTSFNKMHGSNFLTCFDVGCCLLNILIGCKMGSRFDHCEKVVEKQYAKLNAIQSHFWIRLLTVLPKYGSHSHVKGSSGSNGCTCVSRTSCTVQTNPIIVSQIIYIPTIVTSSVNWSWSSTHSVLVCFVGKPSLYLPVF